MPELLNAELVESLATALDAMAFITLAPPEEPLLPPDEPVLIRIAYRGARSGRVELVASRGLGRMLLDNTLAHDPSDTLVMPNPDDALVELANVTSGILLKRFADGARCEMSIPELTPFDAEHEWDAFVASGEADVVIADGSVVAIRAIGG